MLKKLRVTIIQHSYIADENQKNLDYLGEELELQAIVPKWLREDGQRIYGDSFVARPMIKWQTPVYIPGTKQMLLYPFGRLLAEHRPDLIVVGGAPWSPLVIETLLLAKLFAPRARIVCNVQKNTYQPNGVLKGAVKKAFRQATYKRIAAYVVASSKVEDLYRHRLGIAPKKIYIRYPLGVDLDLFCPCTPPSSGSNQHAIIGYCGKFHPRKGVPELIEAAKKLVNEYGLSIQLRLLGDGLLRPTLEREAACSTWLSIEGPVAHKDVASFLQGCDIFAFPSRTEPDHEEHDGHALAEAMAVGLPAVTTSSGIIPELTTEESALTVRENSPEVLAQALAKLVRSPALREGMGRHARSLALDFGLATLAKRHADIYQEIAGE
jgi:glycosyltransferase involved in cell wall biosynthesis